MQKDVHFYLTYALARLAGTETERAKIIAWANWNTDLCTKAKLHGIQTQASPAGNWNDRAIQHTVIVPFHFVPGEDGDQPWAVTPDSTNARKLVAIADDDPLQLGIALHSLQDTYSHQGFTGCDESANSCFGWSHLLAALVPNVGHADMGGTPDVVNYTWTDPRTGNVIMNRTRAAEAAKATYHVLAHSKDWERAEPGIRKALWLKKYDSRKKALAALTDTPDIRFSAIARRMKDEYGDQFVAAGRRHQAVALKLMA